jgi:hypothetical protein
MENYPKKIFASTANDDTKDESIKSFHAKIYYLTIKNLQHLKISKKYNGKKTIYLLKKAHIPLYFILDIHYKSFAEKNLDDVYLYFSHFKKYIYAKKKLTKLLRNKDITIE